jgi:DNA recombination protein RmuC
MAFGTFGFALGTLIMRQKSKVLAASLDELRNNNQGVFQQKEILEVRCRELDQKLGEKENSIGELRELKARLEAQLEGERAALTREREQFGQMQEQLNHSFKSLAASALEGNNKQFMALAKEMLSQETHKVKGDLERRQLAIHETLRPLNEAVERYQQQVMAMEKDRQRSYEKVEGELKRVVETSQSLTQETQHLKNALKKPHIRGRWGEVQLKNCIELAGMSEYADVSFQASGVGEEGQRLIPDMTVRMPGGRIVYVDAKTPLNAFLESMEAETDEQKTIELARHGRHVKEHIKLLSQKDYAKNLGESADFTVLFLPNESFLYAALETEGDLIDYALSKKILIATPPTFIGLLKVIRFGWNEERLAENAQKISDVGVELHKRLIDFVETFVNIGKSLDKAKVDYDAGMKRLNSRVIVQVKKMEKLGAKSAKALPPSL